MVEAWWIFYVLIILSLLLQLLEPSPPLPDEKPQNPAQEEISPPPEEEGRGVDLVTGADIETLAARLERVENRLNIEARVQVKDWKG